MRRQLVAVLVATCATGCLSGSGRVHVLGRDYQKSGASVSLQSAQRSSAGALVVVEHGRVVTGSVGLYPPTVIYVQRGNSYTPYTLEGGP